MNAYFNMNDTVFDITEKYPDVIPYLVQKGFTPLANPAMRELMAKQISLQTALLSRGLDTAQCEKEIVAVIEKTAEEAESRDSSLCTTPHISGGSPDDDKKKIRIEGVLPCPIRIPLLEDFQEFYAQYEKEHKNDPETADYSVSYDLRSANLGIDWIIEQAKTGKKENLPDILLSAGFDLFFDKKLMGAFIDNKEFNCSVETMNKDFCNDYIDLRDGKKNYAIIGVVPAGMVVNTAVLNGKKVPQTWADLVSGEYEHSLSLPFRDLDLFNSVLLHIYAKFGSEGVTNLAKACREFLHPAQMVKKSNSAGSGKPAISITPYFFSKMIKDNPNMQIVWPKDGAIIVPIFMLVKKETEAVTKPFADFFLSERAGNVFARNGYFPSTNAQVDNRLDKDKKFLWLGWDFIYKNDIGSLLQKLRRDFETASI